MVQGWVCHTTTYVQATGSLGDRQLQEAKGPGRSHSLLSGGPAWQPAYTSPSTSPHPPEVGPPHIAAWVYVCVCTHVYGWGRNETLSSYEWLFRTGSPCND